MAAIDPLHQFKIVTVVPGPTFHVGELAVDLSITNVTLSMLIAAGLVTLFFAVLSIRPKVVPGRLQVVGEGLFGLIDDLAASMIGEESVKYFPFIFTLFSFILVMNMLGLFIFFHTATSQLAVTATLAIMTILTVIIVGFLRNGLGFFKLFVPSGVPLAMLPFLLVPIEFISFMVRPLTLAIRLFGNMLGGHIVMNMFASFVVGARRPRRPGRPGLSRPARGRRHLRRHGRGPDRARIHRRLPAGLRLRGAGLRLPQRRREPARPLTADVNSITNHPRGAPPMDVHAAKYIGAGLAMIGLIGAGIGLGILFGNWFRPPCATRPPRRRAPDAVPGLGPDRSHGHLRLRDGPAHPVHLSPRFHESAVEGAG